MTAQPERPWTTADVVSAIVLMAAVLLGAVTLVKNVSALDAIKGIAGALGIVASALGGLSDLARRRVPNVLTLPLLAIALALAVARWTLGRWGSDDIVALAVAWAVCSTAWVLRLFGGGDAKLAMSLLGFFPTSGVALCILVSLMAGSLVYLACGPDRSGWSRLRRLALTMMSTRALPARTEVVEGYRRRAHPAAAWIGAGFCLSLALGAAGVMI